eukprot:2348212-Amphidinium_carterae.1
MLDEGTHDTIVASFACVRVHIIKERTVRHGLLGIVARALVCSSPMAMTTDPSRKSEDLVHSRESSPPGQSAVACHRGLWGPFTGSDGAAVAKTADYVVTQPALASTLEKDNSQGQLTATTSAFSSVSARRSATPNATRTTQQALATLAESVSASVTALQQQTDADRRRLSALERRLDAAAEERSKECDWRDKLADVQGSVAGLLDEAQSQARRVDGLEERFWVRAGNNEGAKQKS